MTQFHLCSIRIGLTACAVQEKLLELEQKDRENKQILDYIEHICEEELKGQDRNGVKKRMYREELDKCLADNIRRRNVSAEQDRMLNERVLQQRKELDVSQLS